MLNGTYNMRRFLTIARYNNGRLGAEKTLRAETRDRVFIDFNKNEMLRDSSCGLWVGGAYWILDGFHFRNTPDKTKGIVVGGYNNILRYLTIYNIGDTGLQLSGNNSEPKRYWPSGNSIEYCESFNNMDAAETDADGFAAKLTVGIDNQFLWCIAHTNNDDGWDLFTKKETGSIGVVRLFGCVTYNNRRLLRGELSRSGAGNGYKLGGEGIPIAHEIHHSISFWDRGAAYTSNSNPAANHFNCTSISSNGDGVGGIAITTGDPAFPPFGLRDKCFSTQNSSLIDGINTDYSSILFTFEEKFGIQAPAGIPADARVFMTRKEDGRPDFGTVYQMPQGGSGAYAFYSQTKMNPPSSFLDTSTRGIP